MKRINYLLVGCLSMALSSNVSAQKITVHTIGDSTMSNRNESEQIRGWGQMFQQFFNPEFVTVNNRSQSGASSKSFYVESSYWTTVKPQIKSGDYVIIQFAHNDEKSNGMDGDELKALYTAAGKTSEAAAVDYRGTSAQGTFKEILTKYINETRALGATPVLATSICRNYWSGNKISNTGMHNLADKFFVWDDVNLTTIQKSTTSDDHTYDYPYAMKELGEALDVPVIDITTMSKELFEANGQSQSASLFFAPNDNTHLSEVGATTIARFAAEGLKSLNILADYIEAESDIMVNPSELSYGKSYEGKSEIKEISVTGFNFDDSEGYLIITSKAPVFVSSSYDGEYSENLNIAYTGGAVNNLPVYVKFEYNVPGETNDFITITAGSKSKNIPVSGETVSKASGIDVVFHWPLESNNICNINGEGTALEQLWSEMALQRYQAPNSATKWPEGSGFAANHSTQRNFIDNVDNRWPAGEIDEVSTRYIQFGVKAADETILHVDSIGFYVCGAGGNGMRCHVYYQIDNEPHVAMSAEGTDMGASMTSNTMYAVSAKPILSIKGDQTLYVRIYPWYNGEATGKTICLSNLMIRGISEMANSVTVTEVDKEIVSVEYYTLEGIRINDNISPKGMVIAKYKFTDGSVKSIKTIK